VDAELVTMARFAEIIGVNIRTVQRLSQENVLKAVDDPDDKRKKLLPLDGGVQAYIDHRLKQAAGQERARQRADLEEKKLRAEVSLKETESELKRMRHDVNSGKYLLVEEVQLDYSRFFVILKKFLLAIPNRVAGMLAGHVDPVTARGIEKDILKDVAGMLKAFVVTGQSGTTAAKDKSPSRKKPASKKPTKKAASKKGGGAR
jgi:phage terminase Nu1 subunit (DNA packaging protein)